MDTFLIYNKINEWFDRLCLAGHIEHKEKYLNLTDYSEYSLYRTKFGFKDINDPTMTEKEKKKYLFAQFCYHRHNGYLLYQMIRLKDYPNYKGKENVLKNLLCEFDYEEFVNKFDGLNDYEIGKLVYDSGLTWNFVEKVNNEKVNIPYEEYDFSSSMVTKYFKTLLGVAKYLSKEDVTRESFIEKMKSLVPQDLEFYIGGAKFYLIRNGIVGFEDKLVADLLKELDPYFMNLCKPDLHIRKFIETVYGKCASDTECMQRFDEFLKDLQTKVNVIGYELDRKLYLIMSGNFFLDDINLKNKYKDQFLEDIKSIL